MVVSSAIEKMIALYQGNLHDINPGLNRDFPTQKWRKRRRDGVSGNFSDTP